MSTYFPVRLNTIRTDEVIPFDVYLKLSHRYVHYMSRDSELEAHRLTNLKEHGVKKVFIRPEHEDAYLKFLERGLNALNSSSMSVPERAIMAHATLIDAAENAERTLETEERYNGQKKQFDKIANFLSTESSAIRDILAKAGVSVDHNEHAANVSSLSVAMATKLGITDNHEIFELGMAGLLHDIGKNRLKFDHMKPVSQMTPQELKAYKNHPQDGADMLAGKPYVSGRILKYVFMHEERGQCRGYPEKVDLFRQELPFQILSLVNAFDHFCIETKTPSSLALGPFLEKFSVDYDPKLLNVLRTLLA
jgi:HD-GYP domain-containing protein (c-di-GMP phosphodiesterase class II)